MSSNEIHIKIMSEMAKAMIWNWISSQTNCMSHILQEVGAELKSVHLRTANLSSAP